jgi:hypothetical protein
MGAAQKKEVRIILRNVPEDIHRMIVEEKSRYELEHGNTCSSPQAVYKLIRKRNASSDAT